MDLSNLASLKNLSGYAGATAVVALVISGWSHVSNFIRGMSDIIFVRIIVKDESAKAMLAYVNAKGKRTRFGLRLFCGGKVFVNPLKRVEVVSCESISSDPALIRIGWRFFILGLLNSNDKVNVGDYHSDGVLRVYTLRGFFELEKLIIEATEYYNQLHRSIGDGGDSSVKRFKVIRIGRHTYSQKEPQSGSSGEASSYRRNQTQGFEVDIRTKTLRVLGWKIQDIGVVAGKNTAFNVFFYPPNVMEAVEEVRSWIKNESWFKDKGINWRLGWLLHGKPGTGKSTLVRSIGMEFDLPIYVLDLSCLDNNSFTEAWQEIQQNAPAIALIEDIDTVFDKRVNITAKAMGDSLTFDCVLNTISGVNNSDGAFVILTTNDITKLDPALGVLERYSKEAKSTRPGRVDRIIELVDMQHAERVKVANHVLNDFPELINETINDGAGESAAQFQDRCTRIAMAKFWERQK